MATNRRDEETYSEEETQRRVEAALKGAFKTPPKPIKAKQRLTDSNEPGEKKGDARTRTGRRPA